MSSEPPVPGDIPAEHDEALHALRRIRAAVRSGVTPPKRKAARREARPGPDGRDPQLLGSVLDDVIEASGWTQRSGVAQVLARWPEFVGPEVAEHVGVHEFSGDTLVLRADSTAWATQMRLLSATILRRLASELGEGVVARITVLGPDAPSWRFGSRHIPGRGPRDTFG